MSAELEPAAVGVESIGLPRNQHVLEEKEPNTRALFLVPESGKEFAPVDELTQMPLPVMPPRRMPPHGKPEIANWHHHYHPSNSKLLTSAAGLAVRHVRVQLLPVEKYHNQYHRIFEGPVYLPKTNAERFGQIILACAGYVPPHAIDVHKDDPTEPVLLSTRMKHRLQKGREIEVRGHTNIGGFIFNFSK
jgi:hypothetical protein